MAASQPSPLRQLLQLMTEQVAIIEASVKEHGTNIPDLHEPFTLSSESFRSHPPTQEAAKVACAAAYQFAAILSPPQQSIYHVVGGVSSLSTSFIRFVISRYIIQHFRSSAVRACLECAFFRA